MLIRFTCQPVAVGEPVDDRLLLLAVAAVGLIEIDEGEFLPVVAELPVLFLLDLVDPAEISGGGDRVILGGGQFGVFLPDILGDVRERQGLLPGDFLDLVVILDVLLGRVLNRLPLQTLGELLEVIRVHVPDLVVGVVRKRRRFLTFVFFGFSLFLFCQAPSDTTTIPLPESV